MDVATVDGRDCPTDDELAAFLDGSANDATRARLEAHFDQCERCRAAVGHIAAASSGPRMIDRYKLEERLGAGGMGVVWRAWDPALERPVAIKLLHPELHDDAGRERAMREARALARLQHPNVLAVYDVGEHEGDVFIATELNDGLPMDRWQRDKSPREIVAAYAQAARGLAAAHALGLVHRDVKPSNILVSRDGRVRVGDFGLATNAALSSVARAPAAAISPSTPLPKLTEDGELLGTPAYMAPEQRTSAEVDARADQYSLCLALAEALLGKQPPFDPTVATLAASGIDAPWAAIARGLRDHARERYSHIEELIAALEPAPPTRKVLPLALGTLALAAVAGTALYLSTRDDKAPPPPAIVAPAPPAPEVPWMWKTEVTGPWLLPINAYDAIVFDAKRAVVIGVDELAVVDLTSGKVTVTALFGDDDKLESLIRVGDRVLVIGSRDSTAAAWHLTLDPAPRVTPLDYPPAPATKEFMMTTTNAVVSPDGSTIYACTNDTLPVLRDAATLAIVRAFPTANCFSPRFTDNGHLVHRGEGSDMLLDLTTGKETPLDRKAPAVRHGPGTLRIELEDGIARVFDGKRRIRIESVDDFFDTVHWNARYVVVEHFQKLVIHPLDPGDDLRTVELPEIRTLVALGDTFAIAISGRSILRIDLATGRMQKPPHNLAAVLAVAPRGGSVLAMSDKLRVWRDAKIVGTTESASELAVGSASAPVALLDHDKLELWTPETGDRERIQEIRSFGLELERHGDTLVVVNIDRLLRGTTTAGLQSWLALRDDVRVTSVDVVHERLVLATDHANHLVDVKQRTAWSFGFPDDEPGGCRTVNEVAFSPDGTTLALYSKGLVLVDHRNRVARSIEWEDSYLSWEYLSTGELVVVGRSHVTILDATGKRAIWWPTEIVERPQQIGVSPDDAELAIAYHDGTIAWIDLRALRTHAQPVTVTETPVPLCTPKQPATYESLVVD